MGAVKLKMRVRFPVMEVMGASREEAESQLIDDLMMECVGEAVEIEICGNSVLVDGCEYANIEVEK